MKSCDLSILSEKLVGLDYDDAVLCCGLNNTLNVMQYSNHNLYFMQGRGICFVSQLLDKLNIDYKLLSTKELLSKKINQIMVILPFIDFDKIKDINPKVVQFFHTYGTYSIVKIDEKNVYLKGGSDDCIIDKIITLNDLELLSKLTIKPLDVPYKIIYINNPYVDKQRIKNCIQDSLKDLIKSEVFMDDIGGWYKGADFYKNVRVILKKGWNSDFNKVSKYVFIQSIQNGSSFFYRKEFYIALSKKYGNYKKDLMIAGNLWRKLSRYLTTTVLENKNIDKDFIDALFIQIEELELKLFEELEMEIKNVI